MSELFNLSFAGLSFQVEAPNVDWRKNLEIRYNDFLAGIAPSWCLTLRHDPNLADGHDAWAIHTETDTLFRIATYRGRIDFKSQIAEVKAPSLEHSYSALERTLAFICAVILPRSYDGLLLHACGVANDEHGFAFAGASGVGKSTIARLAWNHAHVLSDENVIVCLQRQFPVLHSSPFWGQNTPEAHTRRRRLNAPLRAMFFLKHDSDFSLRRLSSAEAILALLASDKAAVERTSSAQAWLDTASRLLAITPAYELGFRPSPDLWSFLASEGFRVLDC